MTPVELKKDIFWVGAVNFGCHDFHGYSIAPRGTSYNAYLIKDKKNVLLDTVQAHEAEVMAARLELTIPAEKIDYIVVNHLEPDHAGALEYMVRRCKPEKIFCSVAGLKSMAGYFNINGWPVQAVKTGDVINIGRRNIHFIETRMLHWPDSMLSYIPEEKLLISNDAFGQNIAASFIYADQADRSVLTQAIEEYFFNIVLPFSPQVLKTLDLAAELKLDLDMIAPDHGLIFRTPEDVAFILGKYREMALQKPRKKALIFYDTMWHSTELLAKAVADGLDKSGVPYRMMFLKNHHHSELMTELARCGAILAGSPTHNNGVMPLVSAALTYIKGLRPQNLLGGAFGSYGWSGEAQNKIADILTEMKVEQPAAPVKCMFRPQEADLTAAAALGQSVGAALAERCR
ncbi:MAG: FprA family A-type flavoprotein [Deltaproteobacteria bacterium]|jgi:flavorubredoxin|nr:FprA family A-type flavoprotein [Deltaproteobacteria bacterium]